VIKLDLKLWTVILQARITNSRAERFFISFERGKHKLPFSQEQAKKYVENHKRAYRKYGPDLI
jgi:hypothetical protein